MTAAVISPLAVVSPGARRLFVTSRNSKGCCLMTPAQLQRAVARATGEDLAVIAALGFSLVIDETPSEDDIPGQFVDWEATAGDR